jgi:hypothetical protein
MIGYSRPRCRIVGRAVASVVNDFTNIIPGALNLFGHSLQYLVEKECL